MSLPGSSGCCDRARTACAATRSRPRLTQSGVTASRSDPRHACSRRCTADDRPAERLLSWQTGCAEVNRSTMPETQSAAEKPAEQSSESAMAFTPRQWTIAVSSCSARDHGKSGPKKNRGQIDLGENCAGKQDLARYHNALEHASARPQRAVLTTILRDPRGPEFGDRDPFRGPRRSWQSCGVYRSRERTISSVPETLLWLVRSNFKQSREL